MASFFWNTVYMQNFCTEQGVLGSGRFNGTMQNVAGPPLVATKFGLGAEIQSPTGLSDCIKPVCVCVYLFVCLSVCLSVCQHDNS